MWPKLYRLVPGGQAAGFINLQKNAQQTQINVQHPITPGYRLYKCRPIAAQLVFTEDDSSLLLAYPSKGFYEFSGYLARDRVECFHVSGGKKRVDFARWPGQVPA